STGSMEHTDTKAAGVKVGTTSFVIQTEQGKPKACLFGGRLCRKVRCWEQPVKDAGESECRSVMER
ncbi:MAG TPA: hypothetical protein VIJ38_13835, partial [Acidobacteriaceae bacterium]